MLGFPDDALRQSLEFLTWARKKAQPLQLVIALNCVSTVCLWRGEGAEALKYAESTLALSGQQGFTQWHSLAQIAHAQALAAVKNPDQAIIEAKGAIAAFEATGAVVPGWLSACLGFAYLAARQPDEGLTVVGKALQVGDRTGDAEAKSELYRLRGELLLMLRPPDIGGAEVSFRAAVESARKQFARFPELRAAVSLARLLRDTSRGDEARAMLAQIYNWFTEGFDTADLKDARALLDQLNQQ
jgi:tetratricopeptide (TPR) repeat protein